MATIAKHSVERTKRRWAYVFLSVPLVFYVSIRFYPTLFAFFLAFTDWNIVSKNMNFVGFENFTRLFSDPVFWITLQNTFKYVVFGLPISLLIGFILAYQIDRVQKVDGLYKAMYFIPYITSMVAVAWVWRWLYQPVPIGIFNNILSSLGLPTQSFLTSKTQALPSILATTVWADLGFQMIIFLAGIKAISPNLFEAARIDGANNRQILFQITIPQIKPTIVFLCITGTIRYLRIFTQVMNMTYQGEGGPLNSTKPLVLYIYDSAFKSFKMGYAAAMTVILFLLILLVTLIQMVVARDEK
ncbi:carbohydrate ABC transporter permease [Sphaerochaeta sp. S2]|uniref:carbohydrate ABC transporter permease n=1 Tax=Sphaerochaeta sp. S2 TaxID=2798868 RepID=UPI0018E979AE|nr:sugar ABC transporter permease [Sphaerochaeta sp. S2]MBJ2356999.1 sugar ABC transporter permease [Sphaerochaeta sp. S2]